MRFSVARSLLSGAAALCILAAASAARADVEWLVSGVFSDGSTLSGTFSTNVYGYLDAYDLTTDADGVFSTLTYRLGGPGDTSSHDPATTLADFFIDYRDDLHLAFADDLATPDPHNALLTGGASFECQDAFTCPSNDTTRYLVSGFAESVPEPSTWAMMIIGLFLVGAGLRANLSATRELEALRDEA